MNNEQVEEVMCGVCHEFFFLEENELNPTDEEDYQWICDNCFNNMNFWDFDEQFLMEEMDDYGN